MRRVLMTASAFALCAHGAVAGGLERSTQSVSILFEEGRHAELSFGVFSPDVKGVLGGALPSGDMAPGYGTLSFGYKQDLGEDLAIAVIVDQPVGAKVHYPASAAPYPYAGSTATVHSTAVTGLLRYKLPSNFSVYGGLRAQTASGEVGLPFIGYTMKTNNDFQLGYVVGAAWEKPEIAARVALTYNSSITHEFDAQESNVGATNFDSEVPQSLNLEFQTGVAPDTLLFGSVRWVDWSVFDITPIGLGGSSLVDYENDVITYNIGLGRKFSETWSGAVTFGYEKHENTPVGNLGPTDGYRSIGLAATYTHDNLKVTGGLRYVDIGNATTSTIGARFTGNEGLGAGVRVAFSF